MRNVASEQQINHSYNTVITQYPNGEMRIKRYVTKVSGRQSGWEEIETENNELSEFQKKLMELDKEDNSFRNDNLARTRNMIRDLVWNNWNKFNSFITLTFKENITDPKEAYKKFDNWIHYIKRKYSDFLYIAVPEAQERGAIHFHVLSNLVCGSEAIPKREPIKTFNTQKNKWYQLEYYDVQGWDRKRNGYSSAFDLLKQTDDNFRIEFYLIKYITKEQLPNEYFGKQKYYHSKTLTMPIKEYFDWTEEEFELFKTVSIPSEMKQEKKAIHSRNVYCPDFEEVLIISSRKEYQSIHSESNKQESAYDQ